MTAIKAALQQYLDKAGGVGAVLAAAACPICFPKLALLGAFLGLGGLAAYEAELLVTAQLLVGVAFLGHVLAWRSARVLGVAALSTGAFFAGLYVVGSELLAYAGLAGLLAASFLDLRRRLSRPTRTNP